MSRPKGQSSARRQPEISWTSPSLAAGRAGAGGVGAGEVRRPFFCATATGCRETPWGVDPQLRLNFSDGRQEDILGHASLAVDARPNRRNLHRMSPPFPSCPHLPVPRSGLDWRALHAFREGDRGEAFYFACLEYGHALWQTGYAARALLCLDRALGAELEGREAVLREHPLPYAAMAWLIAETPPGVFLGNPRVHFQHYADRMNEPRREQRRGRAWACWALARAVRPDLPGDPRHQVVEPTLAAIELELRLHGHVGEPELWRTELVNAERRTATGRLPPGSADVLVRRDE